MASTNKIPTTAMLLSTVVDVYYKIVNGESYMDKLSNNFSANLLVIGAGAHDPYNMPTGKKLTAIIKEMLATQVTDLDKNRFIREPRNPAYKLKWHICNLIINLKIIKRPAELYQNGTTEHYRWMREGVIGAYDEFLASFCGSRVYSIDKYLSTLSKLDDKEKRSLWAKFGKLTIAYIIHSKEIEQPYGTQKDDWIDLIINRHLADNPAQFLKNPPTIITFNYDRLFEKSIYSHLVEQHRYDPTAAKKVVEGLPILHVYGKLGDFTIWDKVSESFYQEAMENIKVIGEERDKETLTNIRKQIRENFDNARKIYFLGYGFDALNNKFLFGGMDDDWTDDKAVYSTNIGLDVYDVKGFEAKIKPRSFLLDRGAVDCNRLLREINPLAKAPPEPRVARMRTVRRSGGFVGTSDDWMSF